MNWKRKELYVEYKDSLSFTIKGNLTSLNKYINAERTNRFAAAKIKETETNIVTYSTMKYRNIINPDLLYDFEIVWYTENNKEDADNIYFTKKYILDGLVTAKILSNDGRKNVRHINCKIFTDSKNPRIEVIIKLAI